MPRPSDSVWEHFPTVKESDGIKHVKCKYCLAAYTRGNATKLKQHLNKCKMCPNNIKENLVSTPKYGYFI